MYLKRIAPPKILSEFIVRSKKAGYFDADVSDMHLTNLRFLPLGDMLRNRIVHEWTNIGTNYKSNIKMYTETESDAKNGVTFIEKYKEITKDMDPENIELFGMAETQKIKKTVLHGQDSEDMTTKIELTAGGRELVGFYVVSEMQSLEYFYNVQRQRKLWWMKYASHPGRFSLSEVREEKIRNLKVKTVWLLGNYDFGVVPLESIQLMPGSCFQTKAINPKTETSLLNKVIKTCTPLDVATLETTIDCIDAGEFGEMAIHRKLAPYQCVFYCLAEDDTTLNELKELARLLQLKFENLRINTMDLDQSLFKSETDLKTKYFSDDAIGVPYGILLERSSLQTGILKLRSRDTTLHEQVHISHIEAYLEKIFNS